MIDRIARVLAPVRLQAARVLRGETWIETLLEDQEPGDDVDLADVEREMADIELQSPADGTGPLIRRLYRVHIADAALTPHELIEAFRTEPNAFSPTSFAVFESDGPGACPPDTGLVPGADVTVTLPGPWDGPVRVAETSDDRVRLYCRNGHMEAGRIDFTAGRIDDATHFTIDSVARSGDPVFDVVYRGFRIGKQFQSEMWAQVLEAGVRVSGGHQQGRLMFRTTTYQRLPAEVAS